MKSIFTLLLLLTIGVMSEAQDDIKLKIVVSCDDSSVRSKVQSGLSNKFRDINDVKVSSSAPDFELYVSVLKLTVDSSDVGVTLSILLTEPSAKDENARILLSNHMYNTPLTEDDLDETYFEIVSFIDADFFEAKRQD